MADNRNFAALDWLIHEIGETLKEARQALEAFVENPKDSVRIRFCLTHIHQVHGSLQMVEFFGAAMLAEEMERLTQAMIQGGVSNMGEAQEVLMRAILQFPAYLEQVKSTRKDNPLVVLPLLNDLRAVRGESLLTDTKLFVPNLAPAKKVTGQRSAAAQDNVQFQAMALKLRQMYQYAAAGFIRNVNTDENLAYLQKVFSRLHKLTQGTARHALWDICMALGEALEKDALEISVAIKNILRQLDKEIKILAVHGTKALNSYTNDELIKNLLYYVARAGKHAPGFSAQSHLHRIYNTYQLDDALIEGSEAGDEATSMMSTPDPEAMRSVVQAIKTELDVIKHGLDVCLAGGDTQTALGEALPVVKRIADTMAVLGLGDLRKQVLEQGAALELVMNAQASMSQDQLMGVASKVLEIEDALDAISEQQSHSSTDLNAERSEADITLTRAKESVLRESRNGLEHAKDAIVEYIASQWDRVHLQNVPATLREIRGGLEVMPLPRAARILGACARYIEEQLLQQAVTPQWSSLDTLADAITSVEYYLERLSGGSTKEENDLLLSVAEESVSNLGYAVAKTTRIDPLDVPSLAPRNETPVIATTAEAAEADEANLAAAYESVLSGATAEAENTVESSVDDAHSSIPKDLAEVDQQEIAEESAQLSPAREAEPPSLLQQNAPSIGNHYPLPDLKVMVNAGLSSGIEVDFNRPAPTVSAVEPELVNLEPELVNLEPDVDSAESEELVLDLPEGAVQIGEADTSIEVEAADVQIDDSPELETYSEPEMVTADPQPEPSVQVAPTAAEDDDENYIDDEIIEIFVEEAGEVAEAIAEYFPRWAANFDDQNSLTEFRRAFHTLKGSGRMVGANDIGELAWSIENMLNRVIDKTIEPAAAHVAIIEKVRGLLPDMISAFSQGQPNPHPELSESYREMAHALSRGELPAELSGDEPSENLVQEAESDLPANGVEETLLVEESTDEPETYAESLERDDELALEQAYREQLSTDDGVPPLAEVADLDGELEPDVAAPILDEVALVDNLEVADEPLELEADSAGVFTIGDNLEPIDGIAEEELGQEEPVQEDALAQDGVVTLEEIPLLEVEADTEDEAIPLLDVVDETIELVSDSSVDNLLAAADEIIEIDVADESESLLIDEDDNDDAQLWEIFGAEAITHLQVVEEFIAHMEAEAPVYEAPSDSVQRALHTLKGSAHMAEITPIAELATPLEKFVKELRSYQVVINDDILQLLRDAVDYTKFGLGQIAQGEQVTIPRLQQFIARVHELREIHVAPLVRQSELDENGKRPVDPELLSIFMAEEMNLLLDADKILAQWQQHPEQLALIRPIYDELQKLTRGAQHAYLPLMAELGEALESIYAAVLDGKLGSTDELCTQLNQAHIALLDMVDAIAAGQNLVNRPDDILSGLSALLAGAVVAEEPMIEPVLIEEVAYTPIDETIDFVEIPADDALNLADQLEASPAVIERIHPEMDEDSIALEIPDDESVLGEPLTFAAGAELDSELDIDLPSIELVDELPIIDVAQDDNSDDIELVDEDGSESILSLAEDLVLDEIDSDQDEALELEEERGIESETLEVSSEADLDIDEINEASAPEVLETVADDIISTTETLPTEVEPVQPVAAAVTSKPLIAASIVADEDFDPEIVEIFIDEAVELLEEIDQALNDWQEDWTNADSVEELKRCLHTFKGGARLAGLMDLGDLAHNFETQLIEMDPSSEIDQAVFRSFHDYQDHMHKGVDQAREFLASGGLSAAVEAASLESAEALANAAAQEPETYTAVQESPSIQEGDDESVDAPSEPHRPTLVVDNGPVIGSELPLHTGEAAEKPNVLTFAPKPKAAPSTSPRVPGLPASGQAGTGGAQVQHLAARRSGPQEVVKVSAELLEELVNLAGETSISRGRMEQQISDLGGAIEEMDSTIHRLQEQLRRLDIETEAQVLFRQEQMAQHEGFDPLEMDRYSHLQQLSRSLIESASDLMDLKYTLSDKTRDAETLLLQQSRINTDLQEGLMRSRMVPFSRLVPRLRRIVRQAATELGKEVDFGLDNVEGELDRTVLERMVAPLEHMLRNAVDHGIENPSDRLAAGKPEMGRIFMSLGREGGDVILRLSDDGRGINLERVREKAIERGLMAPDAPLSDQDLMQFILHAGFSTAEKVTQISGRGVGMDVVHSEIKQLGGAMYIDSQWGQGTEFTIRLPFTVSVNRALMVQIGDDLYAVPLNTIEGIVRVSPFELEHYYSEPDARFDYAGEQYLVRYLGTMLDSAAQPKLDGHNLPLPVILVRSTENTVALQVDRLLGSREIVVKTLGAQFAAVRGVSGATVTGDGSVVVILDLLALIREQLALGLNQVMALEGLSTPVVEEDQSEKTIMVVDDSVTVRKVTGRFLEREGFRVITAKDGVEALQMLQDHIPDVMLLDIEMPRMDGFEVAKNVRGSSRLRDIPIIMITSRTGEKHRQHAFELGVNKYMGKPYQEDLLLENIRELIKKVR